MMLAVAPEQAAQTVQAIEAAGEKAYIVGQIEAGHKGISIKE